MNEKQSYTEYNVLIPTQDFIITFEDYNVSNRDTILVTVDGVPASTAGFTVTRISDTVLRLSPAVTAGSIVRLQRETNIDNTFYRFTAGAVFTAKNVDTNFQQILHSQQEVRDGFEKLSDDVYPLVDGLETALQTAQEAADAASVAANAAQDAADTATAVSNSYKYILRYYDAAWVDLGNAYPDGAEIMLDSGLVVKNTSGASLTNNPNLDMTGWELSLSPKRINFDYSEITNAITKNLHEVVYDQLIDVTWFGANGNWNKDTQTGFNSTVAVQNAIAYFATLGTRRQGGKRGIKFPKGSYRIDSIVLPAALGFGIDLIGDGTKTSNLYFNQASVDPAILCEIEFVKFRDLTMIGSLDETWGTTRTPMFKGRLPDGRADIDVEFSGCEFAYWNIAAQIHGRGCIYNNCMLGLVISGMDIVVEDYTHGADTDLMQSKYATMRHYTYRGCRFDNCSRAYTVSGTGEMLDYINAGLFIGNDITNMDRLIDAPTAQLINWCIGGNTALGSFATTVFRAKAFHMSGVMGNTFTKSTNYTVAPAADTTATQYVFDLTAPCTNLTAYGNTIRGIRGAFYRNTSTVASKSVSFFGNNFPEFGTWKGGNSSVTFMFANANHVNLLIKDNNFSSTTVAGAYYLFNFNNQQLAKDIIFTDNTAPFTWADRIFSNTPTVYVAGVATAGTSAIKVHQYKAEGDYIVGHMYFSGTIPESSGAVTISLPVTALALATAFSSVPSGIGNYITVSGVVSAGFVLADPVVSAASQRIELRKQKDTTLSNIDAGDIPATFTFSLEYRYRFK